MKTSKIYYALWGLLAASPSYAGRPSPVKVSIVPESEYQVNSNLRDPQRHNHRRLHRESEDIQYSYMVEEMSLLCITAEDENLENGSNIWFQKCEKGNAFQLWHISEELSNHNWDWSGLWHVKANADKCVQGQPKHRYGSRLRMYDCDETVEGQLFSQSGGTISHKQSGLEASTRREMAKGGAKVGNYLVLVNVAWSTDAYNDDDYLFNTTRSW